MSKSSSKQDPRQVFFPDTLGQSTSRVRPTGTDLRRYEDTYGFNEQKIAMFVEVFSVFDKDGDGVVTPSELSSVCEALGHRPVSQQHLDQLIHAVDPDNSGSISFDKFVALMARQQLNGGGCDDIDDDELHQVFDVFDDNADGRITADELADVLRRLGENISDDEIKEMIKEADLDGDGAVDYKEFKHILHVK